MKTENQPKLATQSIAIRWFSTEPSDRLAANRLCDAVTTYDWVPFESIEIHWSPLEAIEIQRNPFESI